MQAAAAPSALHINGYACLPTDVLNIIFDRFPLRTRIIFLSPVCRRWREAVLNSITQLPLYSAVRPAPELSSAGSFLRSSVCALSYHANTATSSLPCHCIAAKRLTSLTSLNLRLARVCCADLAELLGAGHLTSLTLKVDEWGTISRFNSLWATALPHLQSLSLETTRDYSVFVPLLHAVSPQLTSLSFPSIESNALGQLEQHLSVMSWSKCRHLSMASINHPIKFVALLRRAFPALTSLDLDAFALSSLENEAGVSARVCGITVLGIVHPLRRPLLDVSTLNVADGVYAEDSYPDFSWADLRRLTFCVPQLHSRILHCTGLTELSTTIRHAAGLVRDAAWPFVHLLKLELSLPNGDSAMTLSEYRAIFTRSKALRCLQLELRYSKAAEREIVALVKGLANSQLQELVLVAKGMPLDTAKQLMSATCWDVSLLVLL